MRAIVLAAFLASAAGAADAQTLSNPAGLGYGRHALAPPRHDPQPPRHLGTDGAPFPRPGVELGEPPRDASLPDRPQSRAARHANWCRVRYRSYDGRTDTFVPRPKAGRVRCASPFRP